MNWRVFSTKMSNLVWKPYFFYFISNQFYIEKILIWNLYKFIINLY
jgi:hypothetical protein